jgi:hypothetical protein
MYNNMYTTCSRKSKDGLARNRENVSDISDICVFVDSCFSYAVIAFELSVFVSVLLVEETGVPWENHRPAANCSLGVT